jgi:hypothetical protein
MNQNEKILLLLRALDDVIQGKRLPLDAETMLAEYRHARLLQGVDHYKRLVEDDFS